MEFNKRRKLIIVDMQNDFLTGSLANPDAVKLIPGICKLMQEWDGEVICTQDTHQYDTYLESQEGRNLPIEHCIENTAGWCICDEILKEGAKKDYFVIKTKSTFGSIDFVTPYLVNSSDEEVVLVGTCTDICVVSNALIIKAAHPEVKVTVYENLCAGTSPAAHRAAIQTMASCQVHIDQFVSKEAQKANA